MTKKYLTLLIVSAAAIPLIVSAAGAVSCPTLSLGSRGADVTSVQEILHSSYNEFTEDDITGYFGPLTQAALKQWQGEHGIPNTGTVGPLTGAAMHLCTTNTTPAAPTTPLSSASFSRTLSLGSSGPDVTLLQQFLITQGLLPGDDATGYFGPLTEAAVQRYQAANDIVSSGDPSSTGYGAVGPKTRALITAHLASAPTSPTILPTITTPAQQPVTPVTTPSAVTNTPPASGGVSTTPTTPITTTPTPASCTLDGVTLSSGSSQTFYTKAGVSAGQSCDAIAQTRLCTDGTLGGDSLYQYSSCTVGTPASCSFNEQTIQNGGSVTAYQAASVPFGQTCTSQQRVCTNGVLSGTYQAASCVVAAPASCIFNGVTIPNASSTIAYQSASVLAGSQCVSQMRTCTNGVLSGTYTNAACTVQQQSFTIPSPLVGWEFGGGNVPDAQFAQIAPTSNFVHISGSTDAEIVRKVQLAASLNLKSLVSVQRYFFNTAQMKSGSSVVSSLRPTGQSDFSNLWSALGPLQSDVIGFHVIDEPYAHLQDVGFGGNTWDVGPGPTQLRSDIDSVLSFLKTKAPGRLTFITFTNNEIQQSNFTRSGLLPSALDLIGIDCYGGCVTASASSLVQTVLTAKSATQKIAPTFSADVRAPNMDSATDLDTASQLAIWKNVLPPAQVGMYIPDGYQSAVRPPGDVRDNTYGASSMPNTFRAYNTYMSSLLGVKPDYSPRCALSVYPSTIPIYLSETATSPQTSATLYWISTDATALTINTGSATQHPGAVAGGSESVSPSNTTNYTATASPAGANSTCGVTLNVTAGPPPRPFSNTAPADDATGVASSVTLQWPAVLGATTYDVYLDTDRAPTDDAPVKVGITAHSYTASGLQPNTTYYWLIKANNSYGSTNSTNVSSFTTGSAPPPPVVSLATISTQRGLSCNLANMVGEDGVYGGLAASPQTATSSIAGIGVTSCIVADFGADHTYKTLHLAYEMQDSICGDTCAGAQCGLSPLAEVFTRTSSGNWQHLAEFLPLSLNGNMTPQTSDFDVSGSAFRYVLVCRGIGNIYRSNLAVDDISVSGLISEAPTQRNLASAALAVSSFVSSIFGPFETLGRLFTGK